jgi:hypothetical protein
MSTTIKLSNEIKAPNDFRVNSPVTKIFLAGSIEMGVAEDWQTKLSKDLEPYEITILNPRRDIFDKDLKQSIDTPAFYEQVTWELLAQESADIIAMYFVPNTKSPISLLELGLFARTGKMIVCCPEGFWRKGNVEIVCHRYGVPLHNNYDTWLLNIKNKIKTFEE